MAGFELITYGRFWVTAEALATWRQEYNCERPHSSLGYRTPQEFKLALEGSRAVARLPSPTTTIQTNEKLQL